MNILVFIANLNGAGAQRTTLNLVNSWVENNHSVTLVIGGLQAEYPSYFDLVNENVTTIFLKKSKSIYCLLFLIKFLYKNVFDIVFAPSPESSAVLMLAKHFSFVQSKAVVRESNFRSYKKSNQFSLRFLFYKFAYKSANQVIALSHGVKEDLIVRFNMDESKIKVIYNPVDFLFIKRQMMDNKYLSQRLKKERRGVIRLIAVGRLSKQKGFDLLIHSIALLNDDNIHLSIFGEGEERHNLESLIVQKKLVGKVFLEGYTKNPYVNMQASDIFILSSRWEGFGHVIVESMACGLPVIAFDCKSGPSEIIKNGVNGILCQAESTLCLADEINKLSYNENKRSNIRNSALNEIMKYDAEVISSEYIELFKR